MEWRSCSVPVILENSGWLAHANTGVRRDGTGCRVPLSIKLGELRDGFPGLRSDDSDNPRDG